MKFLLMAASLREDSFNKKLIRLSASLLKEQGITVDLAEFNEYILPLYNADDQNNKGFPELSLKFVQRLKQADALILSTPEYNYSTPGTLKNFIDWLSRMDPNPWNHQLMLLLSASPSLVGGNRGLWNTRIPLEANGAFIYPDMFSLASANQAFEEDGTLKDKKLQNRLVEQFLGFIKYCNSLKGI